MPLAEKHGITLVMELLNSRVNHADYMCDTSAWGIQLCEAVGSERFKLLFDIYHMQIMEGDIIATIKKNHRYFSHYHTGGVPGRHEIDETQELQLPGHHAGHRGHRLQGLGRPGIHPGQAGQTGLPQTGRRHLRRLRGVLREFEQKVTKGRG